MGADLLTEKLGSTPAKGGSIDQLFRKFSLSKKLERPLLRLEPSLNKVLERLLAKRVLLSGNDAAVLVLHEVLLLEATARVVRRAVPDLRVRADSALRATHHVVILHVAATRAATSTHHVVILHVAATRAAATTTTATHHFLTIAIAIAVTTVAIAVTTVAIAVTTVAVAITVVFHLYLCIRFFLRPIWVFFQTL